MTVSRGRPVGHFSQPWAGQTLGTYRLRHRRVAIKYCHAYDFGNSTSHL